MDPVSSVAAIVGLVFNFATAAKTCNDIRGRYQGAGKTIDSIKHELETLQGALEALANLMIHDPSALASQWDTNKTLSGTFAQALQGLKTALERLYGELKGLEGQKKELDRFEKAKVVWNEGGMREHLDQLRNEANALQFILNVLQSYVQERHLAIA